MRMSVWSRRSAYLLGALLLAGGTPFTMSGVLAETNQASSMSVPPPPLEESDEVLKIGETIFTIKDLQVLVQLRPIPESANLPAVQLAQLRGGDLEIVGSHIGAWEVLAEEASAAGHFVDDDMQMEVDNLYSRVASGELYAQIITANMKQVSEEELKRLYEEQKEESLIRVTESMRMRQIYVSTYTSYTVEEGDTLESIAEKIAGDVSVVPNILDDETKRPRIEKISEAVEGESLEIPARALQVGEKLLVPGSAEKDAAAKAKIEAALAELRDGAEFREVAMRFSESENPTQIMTIEPARRPFNEDLMSAFLSIENGEISEPVRTRHGYHLILRENYTAAGYRPFEEVRPSLENLYSRNATEEIANRFFADLSKQDDIVTLNAEEIAKAADAANGADVLARIGEVEITREMLFPTADSTYEQVSEDDVRGQLARRPVAQNPMLTKWREVSGFDDSPYLKKMKKAIEENMLVNVYISDRINNDTAEVTDEEVAEFYEQNKSQYRIEAAYTLHKAHIDVDTNNEEATLAAVAQLSERLTAVSTLDEFSNVSDALNPVSPPASPNRGFIGEIAVSRMNEADLSSISAVEIPGMTDIIAGNGQVYAYWVSNKRPERTETLEERTPSIRATLLTRNQDKLRADIFAEAAKKVDATALVH